MQVTFELPAWIWADHIAVVGEFNQWDPKATLLRQERDGVWRAVIELPVGHRYEFRYLVDDHWLTDYQADGFTRNPYGTHNSILFAALNVDELRLERSCSQVWNHGEKRFGGKTKDPRFNLDDPGLP